MVDSALTRRQVLRYGVAGGLLFATGGTAARAAAPQRSLPASGFEEATLDQLRRAIRSRQVSSAELTQWYLDRIAELNPLLHAVIETNPDALAIARARDVDRSNRAGRALHGIPVFVKDNVATADRMATTAGSLALVGSTVPEDARVVRRLRSAGAVVLGKANLSEWANFRGFAPFNGWSARGGFTRNPYVLDADPCGSSSGSAAVVAANLCAVAVGTETDGSILCPAGEQCLVGIKPTIGLVSQRGIIPISASQDTAGPMTRTVADAARLLDVLRSPDDRVAGHRLPASYSAYVGDKSVRQLRLLVDTNYTGGDLATTPDVQPVFDAAVEALQQAGAVVDRVRLADPLEPVGEISPYDAELTVLLFEFKVGIDAYLATLQDTDMRTLGDLIQFNLDHCPEEMKYFGQELFELAEATGGDLTDPEYLAALGLSQQFSRDVIDGALAQGYDAIVTPSYSFGTTTAATAGYASMAVPVGFTDDGRPVGFWLTGGFLDEPHLIAVSAAIESFFDARRAPQFLGVEPPEPPDAGICTAPVPGTERVVGDLQDARHHRRPSTRAL